MESRLKLHLADETLEIVVSGLTLRLLLKIEDGISRVKFMVDTVNAQALARLAKSDGVFEL